MGAIKMSKLSEELAIEDGLYDTEIEDEDYGFILGPDGELKSVFLPETIPFDVPEKLAKIFEIFGITDPNQANTTLH
jgi:hypothetical protein